MWMAQVCTPPFSSQREPNTEKSFMARYDVAALSFKHKSWRSAPFSMPLLTLKRSFWQRWCPPIIWGVFRCRAGLYQRQLLRLWRNGGLDLSGARVDDKCDSSCHCDMPGLMTVLLIGWSVSSCGLRAIKLLHHCWSELLKGKQTGDEDYSAGTTEGLPNKMMNSYFVSLWLRFTV